MLGRVRAASSTPYDLELERTPSKLIKDDSLSIYEATLMRLKLGARRDVGPAHEVSIEIQTDCDSAIGASSCSDTLSSHLAESGCNSHSVFKGFQRVTSHEDAMMTDSEFSSASISPSSSDCQSIARLQQHPSKNVSVLYLFSKYRSSGQAMSSSQGEVMMTDNDGSSVSISPHSSDCQSLKSSKEQLKQDCCQFCSPDVRIELGS